MLEVVRQQTGLPLAWVSRFTQDQQVLEVLAGDASRFGLQEGARAPLEGSYCRRVLNGDLPAVIPDTARNPVTAALEVTEALPIGAYVGAPIVDEGRHPVGMLCAIGDAPHGVGATELQVVALAAEMLSPIVASSLAETSQSQEMAERIRDAIDNCHITTVFQPIVEITSSKIVGVEALARFARPPFQPDRWFADAHSCGMGRDLELAAIAVALSRIDEIPAQAYLSVNASPATITDPRFAQLIATADPERLVIEITEHAAITDYTLLTATLATLRACGVRVAADDVGAGFASFSHVLELKPDILKVDRSIINRVDTDPARRSLVHAVVGVGDQIAATVVAEGVESREELGAVAALGVTLAQGYVLARPGPLPLPDLAVAVEPLADVAPAPPRQATGARHPFELALQHSPIGKCLVGLDGSLLQVNPSLARMLGYTTTELTKLTFQDITHPEDLGADLDLLGSCLRGERESYRIDKRYRRSDGTHVWGDLSVVLVRDDLGDPLYFISQIVDVTDRRQRENARTDPLTGALLRPALIDHAERLLDTDSTFGVVAVDLSGLDDVNRRRGLAGGDRTLLRAATAIRRATGPTDAVGRWSGASFMVVTSALTPHHLRASADRIGRELERARAHGTGWAVRSAHRGGHTNLDDLLHALDVDGLAHLGASR